MVDAILYAVGGTPAQVTCSYSAANEAYDPTTNTWSVKTAMPTAREELAVGVVNGILYAVGGGVGCGAYVATVEAYDPVADSWSTKAPMPTVRYGPAVGVANGILYAVGGYDGSEILATVVAYDPATNTWTTKAPMPTPRLTLGVGVVNGILYAVGGYSSSGLVAAVEAYDPATDTWTTKSPMPTPRNGLGVGVVDGILYAVGGGGNSGVVATLEAYDPVADTWTTETCMPTARVGVGAGVVNGVLYAVGGENGSGSMLATNEAFTPTPIFAYGVAGDGYSCGDITFSNGKMDAWNSANGTYAATQQTTGGDIGTNGNVTLSGGSTRVYGTIFDSSNITVGKCPDGITKNVGGTPWNGLQQPSQPLSYPAPTAPSPMTPTTNLNVNSNTCWKAPPTGCTSSGSTVEIAPGSYGNITSNSNLHLSAGTYYINSLNLNGGSVTLDSVPVVINLGGNGINSGGTLFASQSNTTINSGGIPANLQIVTACCLTGTPPAQMATPPVITMNGSSTMYAVVYAPNAYVHITGSSHMLGAVVSQKTTSDSSGGFSFDLALQSSFVKAW